MQFIFEKFIVNDGGRNYDIGGRVVSLDPQLIQAGCPTSTLNKTLAWLASHHEYAIKKRQTRNTTTSQIVTITLQ